MGRIEFETYLDCTYVWIREDMRQRNGISISPSGASQRGNHKVLVSETDWGPPRQLELHYSLSCLLFQFQCWVFQKEVGSKNGEMLEIVADD